MKALSTVLLIAISVAIFSTAQADLITIPTTPATDACVSKAEMQVIAKSFSQFSQYANADYCYDNSQISNLISSIMFMRKTSFAPMIPSKDELFTGRFASSWWDYFIGRIDTIEIVQSCPKGVIAYVYSFGGKTMYACPAALTEQFSSLDRASVFMHEARHIDGFPHITCSKGVRKGLQGACDQVIADGGSYAVTVETYAQLGKFATDVHPALKAYAKASAVIYADEAFETPIRINRTENLLILTSALEFHLMNPQTAEYHKVGNAKAAGHIVRRSQHMIMIPDDKNLKAEYVFSVNQGDISQSPSEAMSEYNAQTPTQKENLVDMHIGGQWNVRVYKNLARFVCDPTSATVTDIQMPTGKVPASLVYPAGYDRVNYTVQLTMQSGEIYDLGCVNRKASFAPSATKLDRMYKRIQKAGNVMFGMMADGHLYRIDNGISSPIGLPIDGSIIEIVPQQSFDFYETN
ncbi:MAG: hypothetical protein H7328_06410 [Bdellovibrio sp.]|nr:hypothetical protein [Bdellovibrio sp.]